MDFIENYKLFLNLDISLACCSIIRAIKPMELIIGISNTYGIYSKVHELMHVKHHMNNSLTMKQYISKVQELSTHSQPFDLMFCLFMHNSPSIFIHNDILAIDLSIYFFPFINPWNVKYVLFG